MSKTMLDIWRSLGRSDALALRKEAVNMNGTQIIDREHCVPAFDPSKDYTNCPINTPVADEGQVWLLLQPYNAAYYPGRPSTLRALWGLAHTTNPARAKPWVDPYGTSGMYMRGECYKKTDGTVWRSIDDNQVYNADVLPNRWEQVVV